MHNRFHSSLKKKFEKKIFLRTKPSLCEIFYIAHYNKQIGILNHLLQIICPSN